MVGTLLKIGNGRMPVGQIKRILAEKIVAWQVQLRRATASI